MLNITTLILKDRIALQQKAGHRLEANDVGSAQVTGGEM
jgi:hypothetical protein